MQGVRPEQSATQPLVRIAVRQGLWLVDFALAPCLPSFAPGLEELWELFQQSSQDGNYQA
ncbi:hypothetical protein DB35_24065 [Streptomyces abyssalis]|uniref:Uncharacterized protein n=1 Tax=Streptomyces abyssalis TaxID=933944 RepID=A0A1E7JNM6_9ACTN|nr:hypothetical protein DB35_24065 [Streptomyces abyssalis]OEU89882.1 hypothetical protein AN215_09475 [Streptomyces abyssalis]OEV06494.1 hypothetical protein AN219_34440 [Streptomyces nanshensis]